MKTYVVMLAKLFPGTHQRKGQHTFFASQIEIGVKVHTIRKNYALWKHRIDQVNAGMAQLEVRQWTGKPYRSKQRLLFRFTGNQVGIERINRDALFLWAVQQTEQRWKVLSAEDLAQNDGLLIDDFQEWFKKYNHQKDGDLALIHFTEMRYATSKAMPEQ